MIDYTLLWTGLTALPCVCSLAGWLQATMTKLGVEEASLKRSAAEVQVRRRMVQRSRSCIHLSAQTRYMWALECMLWTNLYLPQYPGRCHEGPFYRSAPFPTLYICHVQRLTREIKAGEDKCARALEDAARAHKQLADAHKQVSSGACRTVYTLLIYHMWERH